MQVNTFTIPMHIRRPQASGPRPSFAKRVLRRLRTGWRHARAGLRHRVITREKRHELAELLTMSDRILNDIGVTRMNVLAELTARRENALATDGTAISASGRSVPPQCLPGTDTPPNSGEQQDDLSAEQ